MRSRNLLHKSKLAGFEKWLEEKGYENVSIRNDYETLCMVHPFRTTVSVRTRIHDPEHLTVSGEAYRMFRKFMQEGK